VTWTNNRNLSCTISSCSSHPCLSSPISFSCFTSFSFQFTSHIFSFSPSSTVYCPTPSSLLSHIQHRSTHILHRNRPRQTPPSRRITKHQRILLREILLTLDSIYSHRLISLLLIQNTTGYHNRKVGVLPKYKLILPAPHVPLLFYTGVAVVSGKPIG
jgi:hypothetical protein